MNELLQLYLGGLQQLYSHLDDEEITLVDGLKHRLVVIISEVKLGITDTLRHELAEVYSQLDELTRKIIGTDFIDFCQSTTTSLSVVETNEFLDLAHEYIRSACSYVNGVYQAFQSALLLFSSDDDIWPLQCQNAISAFQKHIQPHMQEKLTLSSLEGKLFFVNEQVHELIQCIDNFSSSGREKSAKARNLRREIRERLQNFPQSVTIAIEHINSTGESLNYPHRCFLEGIL
jgi:hypothetical protein